MNLLAEGNEIASPVRPTLRYIGPVRLGNGAGALGAQQPLIATDDEAWIYEIAVTGHRPCPQVHVVHEDEEAAILSHPDVTAAVNEILPDIEAWESEH
jgi:hypothetical protein